MFEDHHADLILNFNLLEDSFKKVVSQCNRKSLKESVCLRDYPLSSFYCVGNATDYEYHVVNGLYIYKFFNGSNIINYRISNSPLYKIDSMNHITSIGNSCFEYSCGGKDNGAVLDAIYCGTTPNISVLTCRSEGSQFDSELLFLRDDLKISCVGLFSNLSYSNEAKSGNLESLFKKYKPIDQRTSGIISDLSSILNSIYSISKSNASKKGILAGLLGKNRALNAKLEVFGQTKKR